MCAADTGSTYHGRHVGRWNGAVRRGRELLGVVLWMEDRMDNRSEIRGG